MTTVTVYHVKFYDIQNDTMKQSRRWFTRAGAERVNAFAVENSATEIDGGNLEAGEHWTARDYNPHRKSTGFPRQVDVSYPGPQ
jgi:hypothetical protein